MKINCIAIEDEPLALKKIEEFIGQIDYLNLLGSFDNAVDAIGFLKTNPVDLIFLDIRMKKLSGIQFLESLQIKPKVIITSAYDEFALKGYELDVADYLLKPFSFERFVKSVDKVYTQLNELLGSSSNEYIFVKTEYRIEKIEIKEIFTKYLTKKYDIGMTISASRASVTWILNIIITTPINITTAVKELVKPLFKVLETLSKSLVNSDIRSPVEERSKYFKVRRFSFSCI
jgi:DNA-binding LytR/AlgR family response regulator